MQSDSSLAEYPGGQTILKRVGAVLIIVGLLDVAYMGYLFSAGDSSYSSSFNIIAIVGGIFIRRGSVRAAQIAGYLFRFSLPSIAAAALITPFIFPVGLIKTFLYVTSVWELMGWGAALGLVVGLFWWLDRNLQSREVRAFLRAKKSEEKSPKFAPSVITLSVFWGALSIATVVLVRYVEQTDTGQLAIAKVRDELGSKYAYHLSSMSVTHTAEIRSVSATVLAYSDTEILPSKVSWED